MPVITFGDSWEGTEGTASIEGRTLVRTIEGEVDTTTGVTIPWVVDRVGIQLGVYMGVAHPDFNRCLCTSITASPLSEDSHFYKITATYQEPRPLPGFLAGSTPGTLPPPPPGTERPGGQGAGGGGGGGQEAPPFPWERPIQISGSVKSEQVFRQRDLDGKPYLNTADDPLEGVPPQYEGIVQIQTKYWLRFLSYVGLANLIQKVNSSAWKGFPALTLKIEGISFASATERGFTFWEVGLTMLFKPTFWTPTYLLNTGRAEKVIWGSAPGVNKGKDLCITSTGKEKSGLSLLDEQGRNTIRDNTGLPTAFVTTPYYIGFRNFDEVDFDTLATLMSPPPPPPPPP
jgi:hypothetical protein